jgi:hypothetical protein
LQSAPEISCIDPVFRDVPNRFDENLTRQVFMVAAFYVESCFGGILATVGKRNEFWL